MNNDEEERNQNTHLLSVFTKSWITFTSILLAILLSFFLSFSSSLWKVILCRSLRIDFLSFEKSISLSHSNFSLFADFLYHHSITSDEDVKTQVEIMDVSGNKVSSTLWNTTWISNALKHNLNYTVRNGQGRRESVSSQLPHCFPPRVKEADEKWWDWMEFKRVEWKRGKRKKEYIKKEREGEK